MWGGCFLPEHSFMNPGCTCLELAAHRTLTAYMLQVSTIRHRRGGSPAGKAAPSSLRRMLKWRSAWLLFQAALLMGRSTSTLERYTTLAATTSFVAACMPQLTLELRVVWHAHWGHPKGLLHVMRAAGSVWLLFQAASLVWRSMSTMDSQTTLTATSSFVAACMPQQRVQ